MKKQLAMVYLSAAIAGSSFSAEAAVLAFWDVNGDAAPDSSITVQPGQAYSATLYADVTSPDNLLSWGGKATFTNATATGASVVRPADWFIGNILDSQPGSVEVARGRLGSGLQGLLPLLKIDFTASGSHQLIFSDRGATVDDWVSQQGTVYDPVTPSLTVNAVPLPAALYLFGTGLAAFLGFSRKSVRQG